MDPVRRPSHVANPTFELTFHRSCGHVTWHARVEPLMDLASHQPSDYLPFGQPLCNSCQMAQESPDPSTARLVASKVLRRITAIGFGRPRKEDLKGLKFSWSPTEGLWFFKPTDGVFEKHLLALTRLLSCISEIVDPKVLPALPGAVDELPPPRIPEWAFISCSPTGEKMTLTSVGRMVWADLGATPWPPDLTAIPSVSSAGLPAEVPRVLGLPSIRDLKNHGFTREDLFSLMVRALDIGVAIHTRDDQLDVRGLLCLPSNKVPHIPACAPQKPAKPKGGRPAKARAKSQEILHLAAQDLSAAAIAKKLGISSRSVRRVLDSTGPGRPHAPDRHSDGEYSPHP
jgi:hypothetical protein